MAHKIINKFKEPKYAEFSRKDLVIDIKNGVLYYKSNLGVHRISSGLATDTFGSSDITNITNFNVGDTFKNDGIRVGDSSITGTLTITGDSIITGDTTIGGDTTITGDIIVGQSASFGNVIPNPGLNIEEVVSQTTASNNQIKGPSSFFEAGDLVNISTGSYNQTVRIEDINGSVSMSITTNWAGPPTGSFIYNVDPDLFVVKASDGKTELKLDNRGNLDIDGGLTADLPSATRTKIVFYDDATGIFTHQSASLIGGGILSSSNQISTAISGAFTLTSASLAADILAASDTFKSTGIRVGDSVITGSLTVTDTIIAQEFHTEFVSSSIIFESGSTKFGDSSDDIHQFSGSLRVTGSGDHYILGGNVGIGTTTPGEMLEISSGLATHAKILIDAGADASLILDKGAGSRRSHIDYKIAGTSKWYAGTADSDVVGSGDDYFIGTTVGGSNAEFFLKESNGNVGIGNNNPSEKLTVEGNISASGNAIIKGDITGSNRLLIQKSAGPGFTSGTSDIAIFQNNASSQDASIAIIADDGRKSQLHFGRSGSIDQGSIKYLHHGNASGPDKMLFRISGSNVITFSNPASLGPGRGAIGVGGDHNYPTDYFHAQGSLSGHGLMLSSSNGTEITIDRGTNNSLGTLKFNTDQTTDWTLGNINGEANNNFYIYSSDNKSDKHISLTPTSTNFLTSISASGNITASGNISASGTLNAGLTNTNQSNLVFYNSTTGELTYDGNGSIGGGILSSSAQIATDISGAIDTATGSLLNSYTFLSSSNQIAANISGAFNGVTGSFLLNTTDTLTGDLTVTNNITASGNISASRLDISSIKGNNPLTIYSEHTNRGRIDLFNSSAGNAAQVKLYGGSAGLELQRNTGVVLTGDLTASGNISASGTGSFSDGRFTGNVGIGTTTPGEKLEVAGKAIIRKSGTATAHGDTDLFVTDATAALSHATIQILGGNAGASNIQFSDTDAYSQGAILYNHSTDTMAIKAGASTAITITGSNQNVGIGTSSPGEKLEVVGNISASGLLFASSSEGNYSDIVVQDITTGRFYTTSSVALSTTLPSGILSSSAQIATDISGAIDTATGSLSASIVSNYLLNTTDTLTGDLTVTGTITAQEFHTEFVSASIIFSSGSTQFGNSSDDIATFSGSINVKDPGNISTTGIISGSGRLFANLTPGTDNNLVYYNTVSGELKEGTIASLTNTAVFAQAVSGAFGGTSSSLSASIATNTTNIATNVTNIQDVSSGVSDNTALINGNTTLINALPTSASVSGSFLLNTTDTLTGNLTVTDGITSSKIVSTTNLILNSDVDNNSAGALDNIMFQTHGSERMRISGSGNVGIGTALPDKKLVVAAGVTGNGDISASGKLYGGLYTGQTANMVYHNPIGGELTYEAAVSSFTAEGISGSWQGYITGSGILSSSNQIASDISGAFTILSSSFSSSIATNTTNITTLNAAGLLSSSNQIASDISGSWQGYITGSGILSSSNQIESDISGAINSATSSLSASISDNYLLNTTDTLTGDLTVTGTITAQEFHTEFVSASIIFESGSTQFGNSSDDIHIFSGSIHVKDEGHITASGNISSSGLIEGARAEIYEGLNVGTTLEVGGLSTLQETTTTNIFADGHITSSGNISASGDLYANKYHSNGYNLLRYHILQDRTIVGSKFKTTHITGSSLTLGDTPGFHVTASGNISASGKLYGGLTNTNNSNLVFYNTIGGELTYNTTSSFLSGLISSSTQIATDISGAIDAATGSLLNSYTFLSSSAQIASDISGSWQSQDFANLSATNISGAIDAATGSLSASISNNYLLNTTDTLTGDLTVTNNITASDNISASGDIIADIAHFRTINIEGANITYNSGDDILRFGDNVKLGIGSGPTSALSDTNLIHDGSNFWLRTITGNAKIDSFDGNIIFNPINSSKGVIISGSTPSTFLDVRGHITASGNISASGNLTATQIIADDTSNGAVIKLFGPAGYGVAALARIGTGGDEDRGRMILRDDANIKVDIRARESSYINGVNAKLGIGTDNPGEELTVHGNISASGLLYASASSANGNPYQTVMMNTSSGEFFYTGSYGGGGGGGSFLLDTTDTFTGQLNVVGNITASGNISGSGKLFAELTTDTNTPASNNLPVTYDPNTGEFKQATSISSFFGHSSVANLAFKNIDPSSGTTATADSSADTLYLNGGSNITVTGASNDTITIDYTGGTGTMSSFTLEGDAGTDQTIANGNTLSILGGTGIATSTSATDDLTVDLDFINLPTLTSPLTTTEDVDGIVVIDSSAGNIEKRAAFKDIKLSLFHMNPGIGLGTNANNQLKVAPGGVTGQVLIVNRGPSNTVDEMVVDTGLSFFSSTLETNGTDTLSVAGDIIAFASDKRLKENIVEISDPIEKIKQLRGVTYDWKDSTLDLGFATARQHNEIGLIAQELEKVIPQAVTRAPFDNINNPKLYVSGSRIDGEIDPYKTIKMDKVVPLLIEGIKDQQKQIDELKEMIVKLSNKN